MRSLFLIGAAALALAACDSNSSGDEANTLAVDNMIVDDGATADATLNGDMNGVTANGMAADANTAEAIEKDLTTNDPDTNLANGF